MQDSNKLNEDDFEEAHYHHTIDDFVELLVIYGFKCVFLDVLRRIESTD